LTLIRQSLHLRLHQGDPHESQKYASWHGPCFIKSITHPVRFVTIL
jgi:hypothetical protein